MAKMEKECINPRKHEIPSEPESIKKNAAIFFETLPVVPTRQTTQY